jgi:hypothetical protein
MRSTRSPQQQERFTAQYSSKPEVIEKLLGFLEVWPIEYQIGQCRRFRRGIGVTGWLCSGEFHDGKEIKRFRWRIRRPALAR